MGIFISGRLLGFRSPMILFKGYTFKYFILTTPTHTPTTTTTTTTQLHCLNRIRYIFASVIQNECTAITYHYLWQYIHSGVYCCYRASWLLVKEIYLNKKDCAFRRKSIPRCRWYWQLLSRWVAQWWHSSCQRQAATTFLRLSRKVRSLAGKEVCPWVILFACYMLCSCMLYLEGYWVLWALIRWRYMSGLETKNR